MRRLGGGCSVPRPVLEPAWWLVVPGLSVDSAEVSVEPIKTAGISSRTASASASAALRPELQPQERAGVPSLTSASGGPHLPGGEGGLQPGGALWPGGQGCVPSTGGAPPPRGSAFELPRVPAQGFHSGLLCLVVAPPQQWPTH